MATDPKYFYYGTTRKIVAVFGSMFNNIYTARKLKDGTLADVARVPLSYGPRSKFLTRINEDKGPEISIKLPRMSFEITDISYDSQSKLGSLNRRKFCIEGNESSRQSVYSAVPYNISIDLNIFSRTQDDALQIMEQILPMFRPEYTVTLKDIDGPGVSTDIPFTLSSISLSDDYEGEFAVPRPIIYTLSFVSKVKYLGEIDEVGIIERAEAYFRDTETGEFLGEAVVEQVEDPTSFISTILPTDSYKINLNTSSADFQVGEFVYDETTLYAGLVTSESTDHVIVSRLDNLPTIGGNLIGRTSGETYEILSIEKQ